MRARHVRSPCNAARRHAVNVNNYGTATAAATAVSFCISTLVVTGTRQVLGQVLLLPPRTGTITMDTVKIKPCLTRKDAALAACQISTEFNGSLLVLAGGFTL